MGCPLWESPPPRGAKSKARVPTAGQRRPVSSDYGVPRPPPRRRAPRSTLAATTSSQPPSTTAARRRRQETLETVGRIAGNLTREVEDEHLRRQRERANLDDRDSNQNESSVPAAAQDPTPQSQFEAQYRALRGSYMRNRIRGAVVDISTFPPEQRHGSGITDDEEGDDVGADRSRHSELRAVDQNPSPPPDSSRAHVEVARSLHRLAMTTQYGRRDFMYRRLLRNWSARADRAAREYRAGLVTWGQVERPREVFRELLRLGPGHMEPTAPGQEAPPSQARDGSNSRQLELETAPIPISQADGPADRIDGLGDRDRSPSPDDDNVWDTLLSTLTPDPQPPSVGSSFASAAVSQNTGNTSQTDLTRLSDIMLAEHEDGHECDGRCLFCPPGGPDLDDDLNTDADAEMENDTEEGAAEERRRLVDGLDSQRVREALAHERAHVAALAARFHLNHVDM